MSWHGLPGLKPTDVAEPPVRKEPSDAGLDRIERRLILQDQRLKTIRGTVDGLLKILKGQ